MTAAFVHWHAFAYTGKGYTDSEVGKGLAPPSFPPVELAQWLDRRPGLRVFTEQQIDEAVAWLDKELNEHVPVDAASFPITTRLEYSRARLRERVNRDVWYGYWSARGQFVTRVLVACTDTGKSKGCA
ncbi:hypothetical protein [Streptomyces sp. NPDC014676]|uniref:hypothetical protein n=1 Tax=Streptomyces sp. NPDC014676 TaxID=3364879 RepID=UPI003700525A